ncbi:MAG: hypothetical protein AB8G05_13770 [Oligoflexales bacterium]
MRIKLLILVSLPILLSHWACTPNDPGTSTSPNAICPAGSQLNSAGTKCIQGNSDANPDDEDPFANETFKEDLIPNFDSPDKFDGRFNRKDLATLKIPEEFEKAAIIAKRSEAHKRIWFDLRSDPSTEFGLTENSSVANESLNLTRVRARTGARFFRNWFKNDKKVINMSTHQPRQAKTILDFDDEPLQFYLGGHTHVPGLHDPCSGTMVMTPSPYTEDNQTAIAPPLNYDEIYTQIGRTSEEEFNACLEYFDKLQETGIPRVEVQEKCEILFQGLSMVTYNSQGGTYNNGFDELIQKESVAIWRPKPQEGYKCLGDVTTNGNNNKPFTEKDHAQGIADVPVNYKYAMYCVKEEFVVKGKIDINSMISDGNVSIFKIINDEENAPDGYADGNFFYTRKGPTPSSPEALKNLAESTEVWVLNKKHTVFVEDDTISEKHESCQTIPR